MEMEVAGQSDTATRSDSTVGESIAQGKQFVEDQVAEHPTSAVLLSFVVGAGIGVALGATLFDQPARRRAATNGLLARVAETVSKTVSESLPEVLKRS